MNLLINIHKDSPDVFVAFVGENIATTVITKEELIELIKGDQK